VIVGGVPECAGVAGGEDPIDAESISAVVASLLDAVREGVNKGFELGRVEVVGKGREEPPAVVGEVNAACGLVAF
jgi:hypothetical protein